MKIYVDENNINLKNGLKVKGYKLIDIKLLSQCDIIICDIKNGNLINIISETSLKEGVLIIDIGSKSIDDIELLINNKMQICII